MREDEMVRWHHQLNGHECEQPWETVEDGEAWPASVNVVAKSQLLNNSLLLTLKLKN